MKYYYVYSLTLFNKVIYIGFTNDPIARYRQHWNGSPVTKIISYAYQYKNELCKMNLISRHLDSDQAQEQERLFTDLYTLRSHLFNNSKSDVINICLPEIDITPKLFYKEAKEFIQSQIDSITNEQSKEYRFN